MRLLLARRLAYKLVPKGDGRAFQVSRQGSRNARQPLIPRKKGPIALNTVSLFFVTDFLAEFFFQWKQQVERDVSGLKALALRVCNVVRERAIGTGARSWNGLNAHG